MAYDERLAERLRNIFGGHPKAEEKKMFGGLAIMVNDYMCCGVIDDMLVVRVGSDQYEKALLQPHTRPMDFTGRPMKGYVYVESAGLPSDEALESWVSQGISFVRSLPPKKS